jgi:uncharacterized protein (DUF58 family)
VPIPSPQLPNLGKQRTFSVILQTSSEQLFDSAFLTKLEQLYLLSKKLFRGQNHAERRSRQTGSSLEFADYRNYTRGDDLRSIDWNIYGRLDRLFIKLFEEEQDLQIDFLLDTSASMHWRPAGVEDRISKFDQARRIVASLAYIGLANLDRVNIHTFGGALIGDMGVSRGKSQFHKVLDFLRRVPDPEDQTNLAVTFRAYAQRMKRRGLVFVVSDLFAGEGCEEALSVLRYHQFDVHVIQVLDPAELDPTLSGDLRLIDSESGAPFELTADPAMLRRYRAEIGRFVESIESYCQKRQCGYALASTVIPFEDLVLRVLRDGRIVR